MSELKFSQRDDLEAWLTTQATQASVIVAARAALRLVPLLTQGVSRADDVVEPKWTDRLQFAVFFASAVAWVAGKYPTRSDQLRAGAAGTALAQFSSAIGDDEVPVAAARAAIAADAAMRGLEAATIRAACDTFTATLNAFTSEAGVHSKDFGIAIAAFSADANFIETHHDVAELADAPLWINGAPSLVSKRWARLLAQASDHWNVWIKWYEDRYNGHQRSEAHEFIFVSVPDEILAYPPRANAWIAEELSKLSIQTGDGWKQNEFPARAEFLEWLRTQPREVCTIIAARAALRALPVMAIDLSKPRHTDRVLGFEETMSTLFRAGALARAAAKYPNRSKEFDVNAAVESAANATRFFRAAVANAASAASHAVHTLSAAAPTSAVSGLEAAWNAIFAYLENSNLATATSENAHAYERNFLLQGGTAATLADAPLWPPTVVGPLNTVPLNTLALGAALRMDGTPQWVTDAWAKLQTALPPGADWDVWTRWYDERLAGTPSRGEAYELVFATVPLPEWEAGYAAANRWIKEHLPREPQPVQLPPIDGLPAQIFAAVQFSEGGAGPIDVVRAPATSDPKDAEDQREHYSEARQKALDLHSLGSNFLGDDLQRRVARLLEVLPEDMDELSIVRLWHRANSLRERLADHEMTVERQGAQAQVEPDPAILAYAAAGPLRDFVKSYNIFIVGDAKGRELDRKSLGPGERERDEAAIAAMEPVIAALRSAPEVATEAVPEILQELSDAAKSAPKSLAGDQDVALARDSLANWIVAAIRKAYRWSKDETAFMSKEVRAGVYRGAGGIVAAGAVANYWPAAAHLIAERADALKAFARLVYNNPSVSQMIDAIAQHLLRGHI